MRKRVLVRGPALSRSGYGEQTRFALRSLLRFEDRFDIYLINTNWGLTSWLADDSSERRWIDHLLQKTIVENQKPDPSYDISIQVTIPNEWEELATINIGFTAGIECNRITPEWIEKANIMDKILVVSNHAKNGFDTTSYQVTEKQTGKVHKNNFHTETPVIVTNFPVREIEPEDLEVKFETENNFLVVAQHGPRKNLYNTIKWFVNEFKDDPTAGLILKIFVHNNSTPDYFNTKQALLTAIEEYQEEIKCKIYLFHGEMTDEELHGLYVHPQMTALVNLSHGEGFGLPLFEAVCSGLPVLCPDWGGQLDFLYAPSPSRKKKNRPRPHFCKVEYDLAKVQPEAHWEGVIHPDSMWVFPKESSYRRKMREMIKDQTRFKSSAKKLQKFIKKELSFDNQSQIFADAVWEGEESDVQPHRIEFQNPPSSPQTVQTFE